MNNENIIIKVDKKALQRDRRASLYIAALERYCRMNDLTPHFRDSYGYDFDFYANRNRYFIKVFTTIDEMEIDRYANHPNKKKVRCIIDVSNVINAPKYFSSIPGGEVPKPFSDAAFKLTALLFFKGRLFLPYADANGEVVWFEKPDAYDAAYEAGINNGYQQCLNHIAAEALERERECAEITPCI